MIVLNVTKDSHIIVMAGESNDPERLGESIRLLPGTNVVDDKVWQNRRPEVMHHITAGTLVEVGAKVEKRPSGKAGEPAKEVSVGTDFADLKNAEQKALVEKTFDIPLLKEWSTDVTIDADVRTLALKRVDYIENYNSNPNK